MSIPLDHATRFEQTRRSRITLRRLAIWISLGLICLAAFSALTLMQGIDRQLRDVTETYAVRNAARELSQSLSQAEASQRGFLLTQNPEFLEPYRLAVSSIDQRVEALLQMTADDVDQIGRVRSIAGDISGKMAEMARTVALIQAEREDEAQSLVASGMGARLMSEVSETLEDFIAEEDQKLEARNRAIDQTRIGLVGALIAALLAAAILAYALLSRAQRQVSDLAQRQRGLVGLNEALEAEVAERTRDIEEARAHAERERQRVETLLQDANHRIGNSLATVSSLLALQMMRVRSDEVKVALEAARLRVHAIASAHRRLRLGGDLESASADEFLQAVLDDISATQTNQRRVSIIGEIDAINVSARDATTLGILLGELVTNALKHAFPDNRKGTITVRLNRDDVGVVTLTVADDGVGLAADHAVSENGLGSVIVRQLSAQFGGEPVYTAGDQGLTVSIKLPNLSRAPAAPVER